MAGKVLVAAAAEELQDFLEPFQLGVGTSGTRGGAEAPVHVARQWLRRNSQNAQKVLVTLDIENAFNSMDQRYWQQSGEFVQ